MTPVGVLRGILPLSYFCVLNLLLAMCWDLSNTNTDVTETLARTTVDYSIVQNIAVLIIALLLVPEHLIYSLAFSPREVISLPVTKHCL